MKKMSLLKVLIAAVAGLVILAPNPVASQSITATSETRLISRLIRQAYRAALSLALTTPATE